MYKISLLLSIFILGCSTTKIKEPPLGEIDPPMVWQSKPSLVETRKILPEIPFEQPIKSQILNDLELFTK